MKTHQVPSKIRDRLFTKNSLGLFFMNPIYNFPKNTFLRCCETRLMNHGVNIMSFNRTVAVAKMFRFGDQRYIMRRCFIHGIVDVIVTLSN